MSVVASNPLNRIWRLSFLSSSTFRIRRRGLRSANVDLGMFVSDASRFLAKAGQRTRMCVHRPTGKLESSTMGRVRHKLRWPDPRICPLTPLDAPRLSHVNLTYAAMKFATEVKEPQVDHRREPVSEIPRLATMATTSDHTHIDLLSHISSTARSNSGLQTTFHLQVMVCGRRRWRVHPWRKMLSLLLDRSSPDHITSNKE